MAKKAHNLSALESVRFYFQDKLLASVIGTKATLKVNESIIGIEIWNSNKDTIACEFISAPETTNVELLYIRAHNYLKLNLRLSPKETHLQTLIIECPGLNLRTDLKCNELNVFVTGTQILLPDFVADKVTVEKISDPLEAYICNNLHSFIVIPGCGEFVLDPERSIGKYARKSLENLIKTFPETSWISPVVAWFGTSLDIKNCQVRPGIDRNLSENLLKEWAVSYYNWQDAYIVSLDGKGQSSYGGTIDDRAVYNYVALSKTLGLKVSFYPLIMIDAVGKPWRGRLTGNAEDVESFFLKEYKPFIMHYANLVREYVDAFIIGSELKSLTKIHDEDFNFPFVKYLIELAAAVKSIVGIHVKVTYAADWSEYHTSDGVLRPLDELWSCQNIDVVGIDAYFPLTDTRTQATYEAIRQGWESGEGWDYWVDNLGQRQLFNNEKWNQWKNLGYWWSSEHWVNGDKTSWKPKMKPVWFTEFGFPSVDKATNQPNLFYDCSSKESAFPRHSLGKSDSKIQKKAIAATLDFYKSSSFIENVFYWTWDARGLGWAYSGLYTDGPNWDKGHWIDGKFENNFPLYIFPTCQHNLHIKSLEDIDLIPNLRVSNTLIIESGKSIKIRDDMVVPNSSYYDYKRSPLKAMEKWNWINNLRNKVLNKFNNESKIVADKCYLNFALNYIIVTSYEIFNGSESDIEQQLYPNDIYES